MNCNTYKFFEVISNKTRWKIINCLYNSDKHVNEICKEINIEQSIISHNLKQLLNCNIVFNKRNGKKIIYSLNKKTIRPILDILEKHKNTFCSVNCPYKKQILIKNEIK
jgi:ArsR family transcriptional regulator, lead/cadmium/zinc/bismuth-responsive transcriptional repressor